jgi:hypothetical protein
MEKSGDENDLDSERPADSFKVGTSDTKVGMEGERN